LGPRGWGRGKKTCDKGEDLVSGEPSLKNTDGNISTTQRAIAKGGREECAHGQKGTRKRKETVTATEASSCAQAEPLKNVGRGSHASSLSRTRVTKNQQERRRNEERTREIGSKELRIKAENSPSRENRKWAPRVGSN